MDNLQDTRLYKIGQPIFFLKHANLGGAAGVASLVAQWREGTVVSHPQCQETSCYTESKMSVVLIKASILHPH